MASFEAVEKTEVKVRSYDLGIRGVFGRNRSEKFHTVQIAQIPLEGCEPLTDEEIRRKVEVALGPTALKLKRGRWQVIENPTTIGTTRYADGIVMQTKSFMLMGGTKRLAGEVL